MTQRRVLLLLVFLFLHCLPATSPPLLAQTSDQNAVRRYSRGIVIATDRTRYTGRNLVFAPQSLTFTDASTDQSVTLPRAEVDYVAKTGSYWKEVALGSGLIALTGALAGWAEVEADPTLETKDNVAGVVIGITAAGFGLGALIGSLFKKETTVYQRGQFVGDLSVLPVTPGARSGPHLTLVSFSLRF